MADPYTRQLQFLLRPSDAEFHAMLAELGELLGWHTLASVLGVSVLTLDGWRRRKNGPCASSRKLIWLHWALIRRPQRIKTVFDLITWGRYTAMRPVRLAGKNAGQMA